MALRSVFKNFLDFHSRTSYFLLFRWRCTPLKLRRVQQPTRSSQHTYLQKIRTSSKTSAHRWFEKNSRGPVSQELLKALQKLSQTLKEIHTFEFFMVSGINEPEWSNKAWLSWSSRHKNTRGGKSFPLEIVSIDIKLARLKVAHQTKAAELFLLSQKQKPQLLFSYVLKALSASELPDFAERRFLSNINSLSTSLANTSDCYLEFLVLYRKKRDKSSQLARWVQLCKSFCRWKLIFCHNLRDMKLLSPIHLLLLFVLIYSVLCDGKNEDVKASLEEQWKQFKVRSNEILFGEENANFTKESCRFIQVEFKKSYTGEEDKARFMLFVDTLEQIGKHNEKFAKGLAEVEAGLNEYSDWSDDEKQKLLRWSRINSHQSRSCWHFFYVIFVLCSFDLCQKTKTTKDSNKFFAIYFAFYSRLLFALLFSQLEPWAIQIWAFLSLNEQSDTGTVKSFDVITRQGACGRKLLIKNSW